MTLNEFIEIYRKANTRDAEGTLDQTRTKVCDAYAMIRPLSGAERNASDQMEAYANYRFHILQRDDIQDDDIIVWNSTDYNIRFQANNGPRDRYMYLDAERGGAM
jgi:head-tail adaptor